MSHTIYWGNDRTGINILRRSNTVFCFGNGDTNVYKDLPNSILTVPDKFDAIETDCFSEEEHYDFETLVFKGFIKLKESSVTDPYIKDIVFYKDGDINQNAFFSKYINRDMTSNYTLVAVPGSKVEKFANKYGFKFVSLDDYELKKIPATQDNFCEHMTGVFSLEKGNEFKTLISRTKTINFINDVKSNTYSYTRTKTNHGNLIDEVFLSRINNVFVKYNDYINKRKGIYKVSFHGYTSIEKETYHKWDYYFNESFIFDELLKTINNYYTIN